MTQSPAAPATPDQLLSYIPYPVSATSESLGWKYIRVETWRKPPPEGEIMCPPGTHHELIVPLSGGNTTVRSFAGVTWSSKGEVLLSEYDFIPAGSENRWQWHGGACEYASFDIDPAFLRDAFECEKPLSLIAGAGARCERVRQIASIMVQELEAGGPTGKLFVDSLMTSLGAQLLRRHSASALRPSRDGSAASIGRAIEYIRANLGAPLSLRELAHIAGLSQWHFCVTFRRVTNTSPRQFVVGQRIQRSVKLLTGSAMTVTEISMKLGFSSQAHFSSAFTKHTGVTPSAYRGLSHNSTRRTFT